MVCDIFWHMHILQHKGNFNDVQVHLHDFHLKVQQGRGDNFKKCFNFCWYTCRHQQFNCAEMNKWHYNRYVLYERTRLFAVAVKKSCTHSKFGLLSNKPTHVQYTCFPPATTSHSQCGWVSWGYWLRKWQQTKLYLGEILSLEKNWVCQWTSRAKFTKQRAVGRHCYLKVNTYPFSISYQSSNCRNKKFYNVSTCSLQKNWASECYNNDTVFSVRNFRAMSSILA